MGLSKKYKIMAFIFTVSLGLTGCSIGNSKESSNENSLPERYPNINNTSVQNNESVYELKDNMIYRNHQPYFRIESVPEGENSLSVIGESFYVKDSMSLIRIDPETEKVDKMYYDIMDFVVVGTEDIFYINKDSLYQLRGVDDYQVIDSHVRDGIHIVKGNSLYYVNGDMVKRLDLITGDNTDISQLKGLITDPATAYIDGEMIIIKTVEGKETFNLE